MSGSELTRSPIDAASESTPATQGDAWVLVLLWCRDEPARVGEVLCVPEGDPGPAVVFGRGGPRGSDQDRRASLSRRRPGRTRPGEPLACPRVSREQLELRSLGPRGLQIVNKGRCPLHHEGLPVATTIVGAGEVVELREEMLLLCTRQPAELLAAPELPDHGFGEPDAIGFVGESPVAWRLRRQVQFAAVRPAHTLILGPSGTGKELIARAIHGLSARREAPFVGRNAATIPATLVDAELFGNVRDYPNPGMRDRPGLIGAADRGTLFLDEIAELPHELQTHLLRVLDAGEYHRLGESAARTADLRLVAATNRPADALKHDLLARFPLRLAVPGLAERPEDVPLLVRHLLRRTAARDPAAVARFLDGGPHDGQPRVSAAFVRALVRTPWRTHVRELEATLWSAMMAAPGDRLDLPRSAPTSTRPPGDDFLDHVGKDPATIPAAALQACLDHCNGNQERAYKLLGLPNRFTLYRLVRQHALVVRRRPG